MSSSLDMYAKAKYNESLKTSKRDKFKAKNRKGIYGGKKSGKLTFKKVSEEKLKTIKKRIHEKLLKKKQQQLKLLLVSVLIFLVILFWVYSLNVPH